MSTLPSYIIYNTTAMESIPIVNTTVHIPTLSYDSLDLVNDQSAFSENDIVKVFRNVAHLIVKNWGVSWSPKMNIYEGKTGVIVAAPRNISQGFQICFLDGNKERWWFPSCSLQKSKEITLDSIIFEL